MRNRVIQVFDKRNGSVQVFPSGDEEDLTLPYVQEFSIDGVIPATGNLFNTLKRVFTIHPGTVYVLDENELANVALFHDGEATYEHTLAKSAGYYTHGNISQKFQKAVVRDISTGDVTVIPYITKMQFYRIANTNPHVYIEGITDVDIDTGRMYRISGYVDCAHHDVFIIPNYERLEIKEG